MDEEIKLVMGEVVLFKGKKICALPQDKHEQSTIIKDKKKRSKAVKDAINHAKKLDW